MELDVFVSTKIIGCMAKVQIPFYNLIIGQANTSNLISKSCTMLSISLQVTAFKGAQSRLKSLANFSNSLFAIRVNLLHP